MMKQALNILLLRVPFINVKNGGRIYQDQASLHLGYINVLMEVLQSL